MDSISKLSDSNDSTSISKLACAVIEALRSEIMTWTSRVGPHAATGNWGGHYTSVCSHTGSKNTLILQIKVKSVIDCSWESDIIS